MNSGEKHNLGVIDSNISSMITETQPIKSDIDPDQWAELNFPEYVLSQISADPKRLPHRIAGRTLVCCTHGQIARVMHKRKAPLLCKRSPEEVGLESCATWSAFAERNSQIRNVKPSGTLISLP
jgi:hypothetical protein